MTEADDDSEEQECGFSWDHDLRLVDERDGVKAWICNECGAEITDEDDD